MRKTHRDPSAMSPGTRHHHRGRSPQSMALTTGCRIIVKNAVKLWSLQPNLHWPLDSIDHVAGWAPRPSASILRVELPTCPAELVCATGTSARRAILYLHGGAFLTCGLNTHRSLVTRLSRAADAEVLNIGYRMLPTYGPSAAVADALDGLRWLLHRGYRDREIVLAGDSAGGYLALATALELLRCGRSHRRRCGDLAFDRSGRHTPPSTASFAMLDVHRARDDGVCRLPHRAASEPLQPTDHLACRCGTLEYAACVDPCEH